MTGKTPSATLRTALKLPNGARFYRCALQVNPFAYLFRHSKQTTFTTEDKYNSAIIASCKDVGIEVIGVTDHYRVQESFGLLKAARAAGLYAFSGFEAVTKDGVHFLCLFDPDKDNVLERFIGECGIHNQMASSPTGNQDCLELLTCAKGWGGICIAAHVASDQGGLLKKLSGQSRINVWTSSDLLACALAGPMDEAPEAIRPILANKSGEYHRSRAVAVINASDINTPEDLKKEGSSCFIKMSNVSVEALRQAFLDPLSRIRLNSDAQPEPHAEFLAMNWEGGSWMIPPSILMKI
jgi:PHP family Zn ribbon phosphoesterase